MAFNKCFLPYLSTKKYKVLHFLTLTVFSPEMLKGCAHFVTVNLPFFLQSERKRSKRTCGECVACVKTEDCGQCDFCKVLCITTSYVEFWDCPQ